MFDGIINERYLSKEKGFNAIFVCLQNEDPSFYINEVFEKSQYKRTTDWKVNINRIKTDAPSSTYFRAPGTLEGNIVQEYLVEQIAFECNLDANNVRLANMDTGGQFHKFLTDFLKDTGTNASIYFLNHFFSVKFRHSCNMFDLYLCRILRAQSKNR